MEPALSTPRSRVPRAVWLVSEAIRLQQVEREIALRFGFRDFTEYLRSRRALGWGYNRIARETGQHRDWVRRATRRYESAQTGDAAAG